ncbi:hypothetical protein BFS30_18675 [Pedobacter steynii]|uniref:Uncharacterized protein n=1 Tax=Pedobacter steynii TaxID=430522 RepID=A0A1D7QK14_9SPHI|nr:hypothetical protein BFS30_18675 [Pedobacter steynii]
MRVYNDTKKPLIILIPNNYFFIVGIGTFSLLVGFRTAFFDIFSIYLIDLQCFECYFIDVVIAYFLLILPVIYPDSVNVIPKRLKIIPFALCRY